MKTPYPEYDNYTGEYKFKGKWYEKFPADEYRQAQEDEIEYWERKYDEWRDEGRR